jgi:hypothetical protein
MTVLVDNVPLIGIYSPYPGAGKSTLAKFLRDKHCFRVVKMADPLKDMLRAYLRSVGMSDSDIENRIEGTKKHEVCSLLFGKTPRHAMQTLGTEWGRDCIGVEFWVQAFLTKQFLLREEDHPVVCDDMRFPNEYRAIRDSGGLLVRITRPGIEPPPSPWWKRLFKRKGHASEGSLNGEAFDFEAVNTYNTPDEFAEAVGPRLVEAAFNRATRLP